MEPLTSAKLISAVATANLVWIAFMTVSPFFTQTKVLRSIGRNPPRKPDMRVVRSLTGTGTKPHQRDGVGTDASAAYGPGGRCGRAPGPVRRGLFRSGTAGAGAPAGWRAQHAARHPQPGARVLPALPAGRRAAGRGPARVLRLRLPGDAVGGGQLRTRARRAEARIGLAAADADDPRRRERAGGRGRNSARARSAGFAGTGRCAPRAGGADALLRRLQRAGDRRDARSHRTHRAAAVAEGEADAAGDDGSVTRGTWH